MSVLRHSLWAASSGILMTASRFAVTAILARRLSVAAFGQYTYSQWLVDIGFLVCTLGATGVASRYLAEFRHQSPVLVAILRRWRPLSFALPFVGSLAAGFGAWLSGLSFDLGSYTLLLGWGMTSGIWGMHTAALVGLQRFDLIFRANMLAAVIMLSGATLLPFTENGVPTVFAIMTIAAATASLIGLKHIALASQGEAVELDSQLKRSIYYYAVNIWITALLWSFAWSRGEVPVIRSLLGDEAVGRYAVAMTLYGGAVAGVMLGISGIAPQITRYWGEENEKAAVSLCRRAMDLQLLLSGLGGLALIWLAPELMQIGFGEQYRDSALLLGILALGLPALALSSHNHLLQVITGARYNRNTTLLGVVLLLSLAWLGVTKQGIVGAAWSRALTLLVLGLVTGVACWRRWGQAAIGWANLVNIATLLLLSVLLQTLPFFEFFLPRFALLLVLSLVLLLWVRTEANEIVAKHLVKLLWSRFKIAK